MIDAFIENIRIKYPYNGTTLSSMTIEELKKMAGVDVYGCAWYTIITHIEPTILVDYHDKFYSDIPERSLLDANSLNTLVKYVQNDLDKYQGNAGSWNHTKVQSEDVPRIFIQAANDTKFEFSNWLRAGAAMQSIFQPLGLVAEKFLAMNFLERHASNVGVILNWDAGFMDADDSKYKLMVIDRWPTIIDRLFKRFGGDHHKLPRFCYGFNDLYLLRPVAVSLLRGKKVPNEIFKWFCLWHFRRMWHNTPSDKLFAKAICKSWEGFREVIYQEGYKRNHLFNCLMRILHELKTIPITREQLGDVYPSMIRAALKRNDKVAAEFIGSL